MQRNLRIVQSLLLAFLLVIGRPVAAQQQGMVPAQMTELQQHGVSLSPVMVAPTAGLVTNTSELLRPLTAAAVLDNLQMTKRGVWTSRGIGWTQAGTFGGGNNVISMMSDATTKIFVQDGIRIDYYDTLLNSSTNVTCGTRALTTVSPIPDFAFSRVIGGYVYCHGDTDTDRPFYFRPPGDTTFIDGTTQWNAYTLAATCHGPKFSQEFQNRQVYAGFFNKSATLLISNLNGGLSFSTSSPQQAGDAGTIDLDGKYGAVTGIHTFRLGNSSQDTVLLVGCQRGLCMLTGTDATNFSLKQITCDYGVVNNRCWVDLADSCYVLGTNGVHKIHFNDAGASLVTDTISYPVNNLIGRINVNATAKCWAVHHPSTAEVQWWLPIDAETTPTHALVMNYAPSDGNVPAAWSTRSGTTMYAGVNCAGNLFASPGDPTLQLHYSGDTYNGAAIPWTFVSPLISADNVAQNASLRKFIIATDGPDQQFTAEAYTYTINADGTVRRNLQATKTIIAPSQTYTDLDTWASGTTTTYPKYPEFAPLGSGRNWFIRLKGTTTAQQISLVGVLAILTLGGWKQ